MNIEDNVMRTPSNDMFKTLKSCYEQCRSLTAATPRVALVLGSGLGGLADELEPEAEIEYAQLRGFPVSTVSGHRGRFLFGSIGSVPVVVMQGRVHYYEGYSMQEVVLPIRLMRMLGAEILFLTNAAGGICPRFKPGTLMLLTDQIASFVPSPLIGANVDELGPRFPDMSEIYDRRLREIVTAQARELEIPLEEGVYLQFSGPAYETPAEVRLAGRLGADACGMSTACEAVAARHMGMRICGISCITNMASGISGQPLSHTEVQETADRVSGQFRQLVKRSIAAMGGMGEADGSGGW